MPRRPRAVPFGRAIAPVQNALAAGACL